MYLYPLFCISSTQNEGKKDERKEEYFLFEAEMLNKMEQQNAAGNIWLFSKD